MEEQNTQAPQSAPQPPAGHKQNVGMAVVAYILFFIPLLTSSKNDPFVKFHVKQGLVLFILAVIFQVIQGLMPWYALWRVAWLFSLILLVLFILGVMNAVNGKQEELPIIGKFADKFKF